MCINILAINTIEKYCSVALLSYNKLLFKYNKIEHKSIFNIINDVLYYSNINLKQINLLVFNNGPGSLTGMRFSSAFANILNMSLGTKIIGLSIFDIIFYQIKILNSPSKIIFILFYKNMFFIIKFYLKKYNLNFICIKNKVKKINSLFKIICFLKKNKKKYLFYINNKFYIYYKYDLFKNNFILNKNFYVKKIKINTTAIDLIYVIKLLYQN